MKNIWSIAQRACVPHGRSAGPVRVALRVFAAGALALGFAAPAPVAAQAQDYPARPIRMLVGFTPGASTDIFARLLARELQRSWGQNVIVENKAGANGIIATQELARAAPDGYTLMLTLSSHVTNTLYYSPVPYDIARDFTPVTMTMRSPWLLIAGQKFPANNLREVIAMAKAKPGELNFGSAGEGSTPHLVTEMMNVMAGIQMTHVPYKGSAQAMVDLVGGQISLLFSTVPLARPFLADKRVKPIAISAPQRIASLPEVPTVAEAGLTGFSADIWFGIIGPANMPRAVTHKIQTEVARILARPEVQSTLAAQSSEAVISTSDEFAEFLKSDYNQWKTTFAKAGIKARSMGGQ